MNEEFPFVEFDMIEHDEDVLYNRIADGRETDGDLEERGRELLEFIGQRPETNIAVVSERAGVVREFVAGGFRIASWRLVIFQAEFSKPWMLANQNRRCGRGRMFLRLPRAIIEQRKM